MLSRLPLGLAVIFCLGCGGGGGSGGDGSAVQSAAAIESDSSTHSTAGLLIEENFDRGSFNEIWNESYIHSEFYTGGEQPFEDVGGHGKVLNYFVPAGQTEITPVSLGASGAENFRMISGEDSVDEFYIEWEEYYPDGHLFPFGAQKLLRFIGYYPDESRGSELDVIIANQNTNIQLSFLHPGDKGSAAVDEYSNSHFGVSTGRWLKFGVWAKLNSPGKKNGFGHVYLDGVEVAAVNNVSLRGGDGRGWNSMWIGGTFSNGAGLSTRPGNRYIDNVRWYSTKPSS